MKFLQNMKINAESKMYITETIFNICALFIISAVCFLVMVTKNIDYVMAQNAKITYNYFILIMDRILAIISVVGIIPSTIYQIVSKNKSHIDKIISLWAILVIFVILLILSAGQYNIYKAYKNGDLNNSKMFCSQKIEYEIYNSILRQQNEKIPNICPNYK